MNVNVAYTELAGEPIGFGIANGAPLPANDKHKGSDPKDTAPPTPENAGDRGCQVTGGWSAAGTAERVTRLFLQ
jgi:hypothetical protein